MTEANAHVQAARFWSVTSRQLADALTDMDSRPLGVGDVLRSTIERVGCDCALLVSRGAIDHAVVPGSAWLVQHAVPEKYAVAFMRWNTDEGRALPGCHELFSLIERLAAGMRTKPPRGEPFDIPPFADWGVPSEKMVRRIMQLRSSLPDADAGILGLLHTEPIRFSSGTAEWAMTHIALLSLDSLFLGKWTLGEAYLVLMDIEDSSSALKGTPKQWAGALSGAFFPFLYYLSQVNTHFERLLHLNTLPPRDRAWRIKHMTAVERNAYCRSANRLAPLLHTDLPATIETLVQMKILLDATGTGIATQEAATLRQNVEGTLACFASSAYPVLEDSRAAVDDNVKAERSAHVQRQIDWTQVWWELEVLHHESLRHQQDVYGSWSGRLPTVLGRVLSLLDGTPAEAWFYSGKAGAVSLALNGPCLAGFLVTQILARCRDRIDPGPGGMNLGASSDARALESLTFARRLVCAIRHALGCVKADEEVLRALLWLLSEIGHEQFKVDRRLDFEYHLCLAAMEQPALYGLKPFYRDHLNHVIQVCLTGWMLLESQYKDATGQLQKTGDVFLPVGYTHENLLGQWFMASLLHDVGYVIDIGTGWAELLERFKHSVLGNLSERVTTMITAWSGEKGKDLWEKWGFADKDAPGNDHGVVSGLHVHGSLKAIGDQSTVDYEAALKAIAHHNHPNAKIPFADEQLSALLVLCDELQEWDRPWLDLDRVGLALSTVVAFGPHQARQWHKPLSKVTANLTLSSSTGTPSKAVLTLGGPVLDFTIEYRDDIHQSHSIFNAWLGRTRSFQRIKLDGCPLDFRYRLNSRIAPPSVLTGRDASEPELARLWRIMRDERVWTIHKWLEQASKGKPPPAVGTVPSDSDEGVMYKIEDSSKGKVEVVALDVRKLGNPPPISDDLKEFWKAVQHWRHAGESLDEPV